MIFTGDPAILEYVLKTNFENYTKAGIPSALLKDILGGGIFAVDGAHWKVLRKSASNIFNARAFKEFVEDVFSRKMIQVLKILDQHSVSGEPVDMQDIFFRYTLDAFGYIGFGVSAIFT